jgi:hypothetical protein
MIGATANARIAATKETHMLDHHDLPASNDRLTGELKAAVFIALIGLAALGASEVLVGGKESIGLESWACATSREAAPCEIPDKSSAVPAEIGPPAPAPAS